MLCSTKEWEPNVWALNTDYINLVFPIDLGSLEMIVKSKLFDELTEECTGSVIGF